MFSRRQFIAHAGLSGGLVCLGNVSPPAWAKAAAAERAGGAGRMLVVVELDGGNDGLNTVVPYADDLYHRNRPTLRVAPKDVLKLDDHLGLHPSMTGLAKLWDKGRLRVVNNVGYPNPNRSHSRALEIWRSGKLPTEPTGWLGRVADKHPELALCHVGDGAIPLAVRQRTGAAMSLGTFDDFRLRGDARIAANGPAADDSPLAQIAARFDAAAALAERMNHKTSTHDSQPASQSAKGAPPAKLAGHLAIVRALMEQGDEFRVFYTSTSGFDTHADQAYRHRQSLKEVSDAVAGFLEEIDTSGLGERVLVLVFSEFGRRLRENGQHGTDHGAAAPVLLAGQAVKGGFLGGPPDLTNLDAGDVAYKIDYRDLYASLLRQWLDIDPTSVLGPRDTSLKVVSWL
ncbi:MAG TPA: DUF1501 domain-containing protein [Pirellulales bacterium]